MFKQETRKLVPCRGVKFSPLISLEECQKCPSYDGIELLKPAQNNLPPVEVITCTVPVTVRINYFVEGEINKGRIPSKAGGD
jgi:hypothetical protein